MVGVAIVTALSVVVLFHVTPFVSFRCLVCVEVSTKTRVSFKYQVDAIFSYMKGKIKNKGKCSLNLSA
jgi:hypothetical protein